LPGRAPPLVAIEPAPGIVAADIVAIGEVVAEAANRKEFVNEVEKGCENWLEKEWS
jgi:hypothetical protein